MEQAKDRYEELENFLGINEARKNIESLDEEHRQEARKIINMIELFDEMEKNAIDFEFIREMYALNKIGTIDDFNISYEEYINKPRTNCLMTKCEYENMRRIINDRHNTN